AEQRREAEEEEQVLARLMAELEKLQDQAAEQIEHLGDAAPPDLVRAMEEREEAFELLTALANDAKDVREGRAPRRATAPTVEPLLAELNKLNGILRREAARVPKGAAVAPLIDDVLARTGTQATDIKRQAAADRALMRQRAADGNALLENLKQA